MTKYTTAALGSAATAPSESVDPLVAERTIFNEDRTHRFTLFRHWGDPNDYACGICMNPSGAAEEKFDPTVDRMVERARRHWAVGAYYQLNVMSIRGTYSNELVSGIKLTLPENEIWIRKIAAGARLIIVGWGNTGHNAESRPRIEKILLETCDPAKVFCFGKNKTKAFDKTRAPVHTLYQKLNAPLQPYFD